MTVGEKIKMYREQIGMTQEELSIKLGFKTRGSISKIEKGQRRASATVIKKISEIFGIPITDFFDENFKEPASSAARSEITVQNVRMIPLYKSLFDGFNECKKTNNYIPLIIDKEEAESTVAIQVTDDSMYPKIENGDVVIVRKQSTASNNKIAVVSINNRTEFIRKIVYDENTNSIDLVPLNPEYPVKHFKNSNVNRVCVLGLVVKVIKDV